MLANCVDEMKNKVAKREREKKKKKTKTKQIWKKRKVEFLMS